MGVLALLRSNYGKSPFTNVRKCFTASFDSSRNFEKFRSEWDLNPRPSVDQTSALPTDLSELVSKSFKVVLFSLHQEFVVSQENNLVHMSLLRTINPDGKPLTIMIWMYQPYCVQMIVNHPLQMLGRVLRLVLTLHEISKKFFPSGI